MNNVKWSLFQILTVSLLSLFLIVFEFINVDRTISFREGTNAVNSPYATFFVVVLIITAFYLVFLLEAMKEKNLFDHQVWDKMPMFCGFLGTLSIIGFLVLGTAGPLMNWVMYLPFLFYVCLIYFLFLLYLFIFSLEHRWRNSNEQSIHMSYFWTLLLFFILFFLL